MNLMSTKSMLGFITMIIVLDSPTVLSGKRSKGKDDGAHKTLKDRIKGEDTCVSGYCLDPTYNKLELPSSKPSHVRINLEVLDVLEVDDKNFSVKINIYFGVFWTEERLKLPSYLNSTNAHVIRWLPIDLKFMDHLWIPNLFVYNLVSFKALECLQKLSGLWIVKDKDLFYNQATHVTFMCPMRFNNFPLDEHICKFKVGSSNYDRSRMTFGLEKFAYNTSEGNTILDYQVSLGNLKPEDLIEQYGESGNYSITGFEMKLKRNVAKYVYIYYLPSGLFVCVSWASFTIPPEVVPGRMCLLATLFLALTNIFNTVTNSSPNVDGTTAMKSWMISCILFVFFALLEYASILYFLMFKKKKQMEKKKNSLTVVHRKNCYLYQSSDFVKRKEEISYLDQGQNLANIDTTFLYVFPIMFIVFNIVYWSTWLLKKD